MCCVSSAVVLSWGRGISCTQMEKAGTHGLYSACPGIPSSTRHPWSASLPLPHSELCSWVDTPLCSCLDPGLGVYGAARKDLHPST